MKKILVAPDKFKGTLKAEDVAKAIKAGILRWNSHCDVTCVPLADGGEGTVQAMLSALGGRLLTLTVHDPLMRPIFSSYGLSNDGLTAFIEMSSASGLALLNDKEKNCCHTTSYGTGELIADALQRGVKKIYLGVGGSATNDAGLGMLSALGFLFLNKQSQKLQPTGKNLQYLHQIDTSKKNKNIEGVEFTLINDVNNPLYGEYGAARVFAQQKGASAAEIATLDLGLKHFSEVVKHCLSVDIQHLAGAGAGGGLAAGAYAFFNANMQSGIDWLIEALLLEEAIKNADLLITGEGKVDQQTLSGKVVDGICKVAKRHKVPVAVLCGQSVLSADELVRLGVDYCKSLDAYAVDIDDAMMNAEKYLSNSAYDLMCENTGGLKKSNN